MYKSRCYLLLDLASNARKYMSSGKLVPDGIMKELMMTQLQTLPVDSHWLLDGMLFHYYTITQKHSKVF